MDITSVHKHRSSARTTVPLPIMRALKLAPGDHIIWTFNTKGYAEIRPVPKPHEIAAAAAKKR